MSKQLKLNFKLDEMNLNDEQDWDEDELEDDFDDVDMIKNFKLPMTKEQVLEAFKNLNTSGQNWVFSKIKEL